MAIEKSPTAILPQTIEQKTSGTTNIRIKRINPCPTT